VSIIDNTPFIKKKRKGQRNFKWERVVCIPDCPQLSPFHLIKMYVHMTRTQEEPAGALLLSLKHPFRRIKSDTIGSLTKQFLEKFGMSSKIWGPHSTRGAGVGFMRRMGLTAEEVCEIGAWKNVQAFCANYHRLGAHEKLEEKINLTLTDLGVHSQTSQGGSAEPEVSRTPPRTQTERGGRDTDGEAQSPCEPTRPTLKRIRSADVYSQSSSETRPRKRRPVRSFRSANSGKTAALRGKSPTRQKTTT